MITLSKTTGATSGAWATYIFRTPELNPCFQWASHGSIFSFLCSVLSTTTVCLFGHCMYCLHCLSNYGFWLPLWYLQTLLITSLVSSNSSDYLSGIFKLFWLPLWYLQTLLIISSNLSFIFHLNFTIVCSKSKIILANFCVWQKKIEIK